MSYSTVCLFAFLFCFVVKSYQVEILFYEYLHNEFRRSFPEMHFKLCDLINFDPYIGETLRMIGMKTCPIQPGKYDMSSMTFNYIIPSVWPFEKGMIKSTLKNTNHQCLKVIPERAEIICYDKTYLVDCPILNVRRYNRKGDYYVNMFLANKIVLDNNISVDILFYEYLHNEFRRSFPEMHFKLCDLINFDPYIGKSIRMTGRSCPIQPGKHHFSNMSFNSRIPSVWPFEKGMIEFLYKNENDKLLAKGAIVVTFKQDLPKLKI